MMKRTLRSRRWVPSIATVLAFGALGATCAYWALQLLAPPVAIAPTGSLVDTRSVPELAAAQALFGNPSSDTAVATSSGVDVRVLGVAASPNRGSAVLVVDSGIAKAFLVGDELGENLRLLEVRSDAVILERNGARIELPAPQRPSIALLSAGPNPGASPAAETKAPAGLRAPGVDARARVSGAPATAVDDRPPENREPVPATRESAPDAREPAAPDARNTPESGDPAIEAATMSPRGAAVSDPGRLSGIRASSVRGLGTPANAAAPAPSGSASH